MSKACTDGVTVSCETDADCPNGSLCYGNFNDNGSFTGCAFDAQGHLFAGDIGGAQGAQASPDQGRIIEWFPPDYTSFCIIIGPTAGGNGPPHYVDGTGGLRDPGTMAVDAAGNLYVPESGNQRVLKFDHASLPQTVQDCGPDGLLVPPSPHTVFIHGAGVSAGIARDPSCSTPTSNCWAVTNILTGSLGGDAVSWFDDAGHLTTNVKGPVPKGNFSPFGIAVSPTGDVFFVDIALKCTSSGCDTVDGQGGVFKVSFTGGQPSTPERIAGGLSFPTSVTVCDASKQVCPVPLFAPTPVPTSTGPG
jgi:DNA-binding beta-propeller fold protein YncE